MKKAIFIAAVALSGLAQADTGMGAGVAGGSTGFGLELTYALQAGQWGLRAPMTGLNHSDHTDSRDVTYNVHLKSRFYGLLADWYPFAGAFRATAGLYHNSTEIRGDALPLVPAQIGNTYYSPAAVGVLSVNIDYRHTLAPYVGLGWGNTAQTKAGLFYSVDLGAMYTGNVDATVVATGPVAAIDLAQEAHEIEHNLHASWWPVARAGVGYRF